MSPYIVTTLHPVDTDYGEQYDAGQRRAVATLEEARDVVWKVLLRDWKPGDPAVCWAGRAMPESGGTVGPLPDGTVIEVAVTTWLILSGVHPGGTTVQEALAREAERGNRDAQITIIDAFDARQS